MCTSQRGEGVPNSVLAHEIKQAVIQNEASLDSLLKRNKCCLGEKWCVYIYTDISRVSNTNNKVQGRINNFNSIIWPV